MKKNTTYRIVMTGLMMAIGVVLPTIFHFIPQFGIIFLPMHIPVLICGFLCGWPYGLVTGLAVPFLGCFINGMPSLYPTALVLALELGTYGLIAGILPKKWNVNVRLIMAMLAGRLIYGAANVIFVGLLGSGYGWSAFLAGAFVKALPGIAIQLVLIPIIVAAVEKHIQSLGRA